MGYFEDRERSVDEAFLDLMHDEAMDERFEPIAFEWNIAVERRAREIVAELQAAEAAPTPLTPLSTFDPYAYSSETPVEIGSLAKDDNLRVVIEVPVSTAENLAEAMDHYEDHGCEPYAQAMWDWLLGDLAPLILYGLQLEVESTIIEDPEDD